MNNEINYVILGSTNNSEYLDFWEPISKVWKTKFNIIPVLGLISDEDSDLYETEFGMIKKFKQIDSEIALQSQVVRLYLPNYLNGNCLISDIDMLPISKKYFEDGFSNLTDNNIVVFSADNPECLQNSMYPMCYVLANSTIFKNIFDLEKPWYDFYLYLKSKGLTWYTDQKYLFERINQYCDNYKKCIFLNRGWSGLAHKRIDRASWSYESDKVKEQFYIDAHLLRPYREYKNEIDKLISLI